MKTYKGYHESLSSQAKSIRTYVLLHKTISAGIIANENHSDRHKIDGAGVISKYLGETEKWLNKIFLKPWPNNLVLFFGRADVLMGKAPKRRGNTCVG